MTTFYVNSAAGGANNGTTEADAWTSFASAPGGVAAGDTVWVDSAHNENPGASASYNFSTGTDAAPIRIISVDFDTNTYTPAPSAQFSGASSDIQFLGHIRVYGLNFDIADDTTLDNSGGGVIQIYEDCTFGCGDDLSIGAATTNGAVTEFRNCAFTTAAGTNFSLSHGSGGNTKFINCTWAGTAPGATTIGGEGQRILFEGCDLTLFTGNFFATLDNGVHFVIRRCTVHANIAFATTITKPADFGIMEATTSGTLSAPVKGITKYARYHGTVETDTAVYRDGGATDGTTPHSFKMISNNTTAADFVNALESPPLEQWVTGGSAITITVHVASGVTLEDDELWIEILGPSNAGTATAQGYFDSSRPESPISTPAALDADSDTWTGTTGGTEQYAELTYTPTEDGWLTVRVYLAKTNTTVFVCPKIDVSDHVTTNQRFTQGIEVNGPEEGGGGGGGGRGIFGAGF